MQGLSFQIMFPSSVTVFILFGLFLQGLPRASCDDFGTIEYVAIGVSLGLAAFIVVFIAFYWWRAQNAYPMDARERNAGNYNSAIGADQTGQRNVQGISTSQL